MGHIKTWWEWMRGIPRGLLVVLGSCLILGALLVGFAAGRLFPAGPGSALASHSVTQAGARMIGDTATLGGTKRGFTVVYGAPAQSSGTEATYISQTREAQLYITVDSDGAKDRTSHIYDIYLGIRFSSGVWHQDAAEGLYASFLPSDATHLKDVQQNGFPERIFLSANLAATFLASSFVDDNNQKLVSPGTFDVYCRPIAAGVGNCIMALGTLGGVSLPCPTAAAHTEPATAACSTPTSTPRPRPTSTPKSSAMPTPTATPKSSAMPTPIAPSPTAIPTLGPTATPGSSGTPMP